MSRPPAPRPGRRPLRALAVVTLVVVLGACTQGRTVPDDYTDGTRRNFVEGCVETMTADAAEGSGDRVFTDEEAQDVCGCAFEGIVDQIPFEEFKQTYEEQEEAPSALPPEMLEIQSDCVAEHAPA